MLTSSYGRQETMARYSFETKKRAEEVIKEAMVFFGEGGLGLSVVEQNSCCVSLEGGGGHVSVTANPGEKKTMVDLETREWDYHVRRFMSELG